MIKKLHNQLLSLFRTDLNRPLSVDEIATRLNLKPENREELDLVIDELIQTEELYLAGQDALLPVGKRERFVGKVTLKDEGYGFLLPELDLGEDFYISRNALGDARSGDRVLATIRRFPGGRSEAEIDRVLSRSNRGLIGLFVGSGGGGYVIPDKLPGVRKVHIAASNVNGACDRQKVEYELPEGQFVQEVMKGRVVTVLGYPGGLATDRSSLLRISGFPLSFSPEALAAAELFSTEPDAKLDEGRVDLSHLVCSTIDPEDAKDFDDAITLEPLDGGWLGAVHIADVSFYVRPGEVIDKEAFSRSTSVYLPHGASPMLPDRLSGDLCSLRPNEKRRAFTVLFELDSNGSIRNPQLMKSWIRSRKRFSYEEVQEILDDYDRKRGAKDRWTTRIKSGIAAPWEPRLAGLRAVARKWREQRLDKGGIEFESSEVKIELDAQGIPIKVAPRARMESYELIEEWMLLANRVVTELFHAATKHKFPFVYRIHEESDEAKVEEFLDLAAEMGYRWTGGSPFDSKDFQRFVESFRNAPEASVLMDLAIRSLKRAVYSTKNVGHYGLGFSNYTHFTSPIRRYPDLLVHRLLFDKVVQKKKKPLFPTDETSLKRLCAHCTEREQAAAEAEREGVKWKQVEYLKKFVGQPLDAMVVAVKPRGIFVELLDTLAQSFLSLDRLAAEFLVFSPRKHELRSRNGRIVYRLGDRFRVMITECDERKHRIELAIYDESKPIVLPTEKPKSWKDDLSRHQKDKHRKFEGRSNPPRKRIK